jgi:hypothetical protein
MLMPKNSRISDPSSSEPSRSQKPLNATCQARRLRCCSVQPVVRLRKSGAPPSGFTTGNKPA